MRTVCLIATGKISKNRKKKRKVWPWAHFVAIRQHGETNRDKRSRLHYSDNVNSSSRYISALSLRSLLSVSAAVGLKRRRRSTAACWRPSLSLLIVCCGCANLVSRDPKKDLLRTRPTKAEFLAFFVGCTHARPISSKRVASSVCTPPRSKAEHG